MRFLPEGREFSLLKAKEPCLTQSHSVITSAMESSRKWGVVALCTWTLFKFSLRSLNSRECLQPGKSVTVTQRNLALMNTKATTKVFVSLALQSSSLRIRCLNHASLYQKRQFSSYITISLKSYRREGGLLRLYTLLTLSLVTALGVSLVHRVAGCLSNAAYRFERWTPEKNLSERELMWLTLKQQVCCFRSAEDSDALLRAAFNISLRESKGKVLFLQLRYANE